MKFKAPIEVESSLVDSSNSPGSAGQVLTSTGVGVDWIEPTLLPAESAEKVIQTVRFGEAVSKGDPLVITGYHGSNGPAIVERADATDDTTMPAYGVALEDYANNATGLMIAVGDFDDFDTSSYSVGDTLYVAVGGGMTNVKPTGTALIQNMGIVSRSNANNGAAEIVAVGRTNDVPNLPTGRLFVGTATNTSLISDVVYVNDALDRVGIGTNSPTTALDVNGGLRLGTTGDFYITQSPFTTAQFYITGGGNGGLISFGAPASNTQNVSVQGDLYSYQGSIGTQQFGSFNNKISYNGDNYLNSGNLGIGTTSPNSKLHVGDGDIRLDDGYEILWDNSGLITAGEELVLATGGTDSKIILDGADSGMRFITGNSTAIAIDDSQNVGIGTTSPQEKLHVQNYTTGESHQAMFKGGSVDVGDYSYISLNGGYVSDYGKEVRLAAVSESAFGNKTGFAVLTSPGSGGASGYERLRVTADGDVGIGTTNPLEKLHVSSGGGANGDCVLLIEADSDNTVETSNAILRLRQDGGGITGALSLTANNEMTLYNEQTGKLFLGVGNSAKMTIDNNGNIGIGTTNPAEKLEVNGYVKASSGYKGYLPAFQHGGFYHSSSSSSSTIYWIPTNNITETTSSQYYNNWVAPYSGRVKKIVMRWASGTTPTATSVTFRKSINGGGDLNTYPATIANAASTNMTATRVFGSTDIAFNEGDRVGIGFTTNGGTRLLYGFAYTIVLEYNKD